MTKLNAIHLSSFYLTFRGSSIIIKIVHCVASIINAPTGLISPTIIGGPWVNGALMGIGFSHYCSIVE